MEYVNLGILLTFVKEKVERGDLGDLSTFVSF